MRLNFDDGPEEREVARLDYLRLEGQYVPWADFLEAYLKRNIFSVELDTPIFRILKLENLAGDIQSGTLSCAAVGKEMWKDSLENPIVGKQFADPADASKVIGVKQMMQSFYGVSFTIAEDRREAWKVFGEKSKSVRIATTPRKWLAALMQENDKFASLRFYISAVQYHQIHSLLNWKQNFNIWENLDTNGYGLIKTLLKLSSLLSQEREIRFIYANHDSYEPFPDTWRETNVKIQQDPGKKLATLPFDWRNVITKVQHPPYMSKSNIGQLGHVVKLVSPGVPIEVSQLGA
jgi:hypothetical protein